MREIISHYDLVTTPAEDVHFFVDGKHNSMYDLCQHRIRDFDMDGVDAFIRIIKEKYPEYAKDVDNYFSGHYAKYYNCFIMKKDLFNEYCSMLFDVLEELEKALDTKYYGTSKMRMPGFMAENLFGIFYLHLIEENSKKLIEKDLVYFEHTDKLKEIEIYPAFESKNIPIVFSSSNYFVPYASVFVKSIVNHADDRNCYDVIILQNDISDENQQIIKSIAENHKNISIRFYNPTPLLGTTKLFVNSANQSIVAYYRILTPYILKNYKKAIVMDCDIVATTDIAQLYDIEIEDYCIAAALDVVWQGWYNGDRDIQEYCKNVLTISNPYKYVNTGVVLFNLEKCRKYITEKEILNVAQSHNFKVQEQDVLNLVYDGEIKYIDISWNMYVMVAPHIKDTINSFAPVESKQAYHKAHQNPFLLHWAAQPKPWVNPEMDYGYIWWDVAKETPFYPVILSRMIDAKIGAFCSNVYDLKSRTSFFDARTPVRKFADKVLPKGTRRREFAKKILPKGSRRWNFCKKIYYVIRPQYRPNKA